MKPFVEDLLKLNYDSKPKIIWQMDRDTFQELNKLKDGNGVYVVDPNLHDFGSTLLGHKIEIAKSKCLRLLYVFPDGFTKVFKL